MKSKYSVLLDYYSYSEYKNFDDYNDMMWYIKNEGDHLEDYEIFVNKQENDYRIDVT